jgi:glutathione S-transferase
MDINMHPVTLIILLALLQFMAFGGMVGYARKKYGIKAPAITGNEVFERHFRVHYNTMEQLVVFIPSIWFFATYVSTFWATILGSIYLVGRVIYAFGYVSHPAKREFGSILGSVGTLVPFFGAIYGVVKALLA